MAEKESWTFKELVELMENAGADLVSIGEGIGRKAGGGEEAAWQIVIKKEKK